MHRWKGSCRTARAWVCALALGSCGLAGVAQGQAYPGASWQTAAPLELGMSAALLQEAQDFATGTGTSTGGSGYVIKAGRLVWSWGDPAQLYDIKSATKSFGAGALGLAVRDGLVNLDDTVQPYLPSLGTPPQTNADEHGDWLSQMTFRDLAGHTAGFDKGGGFEPVLFEPGTKWSYSDGGMNWLADALTVTVHDRMEHYLATEVFDRIGIPASHLTWRSNLYRGSTIEDPDQTGVHYVRDEFGAGIDASVDAMARYGYLWLRGGNWAGEQILPADYVTEATTALTDDPAALPVAPTLADAALYGPAATQHGLGWWTNTHGTLADVPTDAFWAWGLYDSLIVVIPSLDLVVARTGNNGEVWDPTGTTEFAKVVEPFITLMARAASAFLTGDLNRDGQLTNTDIQAMLDALTDLEGYRTAHGLSEAELLAIGDINGDGAMSNADIQALLDALAGGGVQMVPEPGAAGVLGPAALALGARRRARE